jgi:hypothetical protein
MICDGGGAGGNFYDTGTVTITVNGHPYTYSYTAGTVAAGLAAAINGDAAAVVTDRRFRQSFL